MLIFSIGDFNDLMHLAKKIQMFVNPWSYEFYRIILTRTGKNFMLFGNERMENDQIVNTATISLYWQEILKQYFWAKVLKHDYNLFIVYTDKK